MLIYTKKFQKDYKNLPQKVQETTDNKMRILAKNPYHPSLRTKKIQKYKHKNIFEGSINMKYRIFFRYDENDIILLRIGEHDILK